MLYRYTCIVSFWAFVEPPYVYCLYYNKEIGAHSFVAKLGHLALYIPWNRRDKMYSPENSVVQKKSCEKGTPKLKQISKV